MAAECTATPDITTDQAKAEHESLYRKDVQFAATLRAAEDIPITPPKATASKEVEPPATGIKEPPRERDYMDEALLQLMRIGEAQVVLDEALEYAPFEGYNGITASKLLSAALDIQRQSIPEAERLIMEAIKAI